MRGIAVLAAIAVASGAGASEPRFFVAGDGSLAIVSRATKERVEVRYRLDDAGYDYAALDAIRHVMRSRGDGLEGEITPRFVELLGWLAVRAGQPLVLLSGYRSPAYNEGIRRRGMRAAGGSLHTEGLAADVAIPRHLLKPLWLEVRALECCGAGYYAGQGFLHVDVGRPRFWETTTSRTDENLSAGNARAFARTDFDRYTAGEMMLVRLHAVTTPPVRLARTAHLVPDGGGAAVPLTVEEVGAAGGGGCLVADGTTRLLVKGAPAMHRGRVVFTTCEPRVERTPPRIESNPVTLR
jgi:uncharacterized protein YcbK (DUF882 family)